MAETKGKRGAGTVAPSEAWIGFAAGHAGHRFLDCDPLYSMIRPLIDALVKEVPDFLMGEDERFERDLAVANTFGFFRGQPLGYSGEEWAKMAGGEEHAWEETRQYFKAVVRGRELTAYEHSEFWNAYRKRKKLITTTGNAYRGWLASDSWYESDLRFLKRAVGDAVDRRGEFPYLSFEYVTDDRSAGCWSPHHLKLFRDFYRKWGLESLATWEWPLPMPPVVDRPVNVKPAVTDAGLHLLIPWYMLRGEKFDLQHIVNEVRLTSYPDHLRDWIDRPKKKSGDAYAEIRFSKMSHIYHWHHLILQRRYPERCEGRLVEIERAFATIMGIVPDTVRKIRLELARKRKSVVEYSARYGL